MKFAGPMNVLVEDLLLDIHVINFIFTLNNQKFYFFYMTIFFTSLKKHIYIYINFVKLLTKLLNEICQITMLTNHLCLLNSILLLVISEYSHVQKINGK